jgi:hypothetical protein
MPLQQEAEQTCHKSSDNTGRSGIEVGCGSGLLGCGSSSAGGGSRVFAVASAFEFASNLVVGARDGLEGAAVKGSRCLEVEATCNGLEGRERDTIHG